MDILSFICKFNTVAAVLYILVLHESGALPDEVGIMNGLSINEHLLMVKLCRVIVNKRVSIYTNSTTFANICLGPFHGAIAVPSVTRCRGH